MSKIQMKTPLVEMDGDEMTRIIWQRIKDTLLLPYIDLKCEYYDLGLLSRNDSDDEITRQAALATKKYGVAVKCATITPNAQRKEEYPQLKKLWRSPNGTIRGILDGTVFRTPIPLSFVRPTVRTWEAPITIARHAYGDVYSAVEMFAEPGARGKVVFDDGAGSVTETDLPAFTSPAVWSIQHNTYKSIRSFAKSCFNYALSIKQDLWFSTKDTIAKKYDGGFKDIFAEEYENNYRGEFEKAGITYFYTLIDDAVARVIRSPGGFIWALKNYDGDVMSDMVSSAFGSLAMMTSVLVSPDGAFEYEAAHGTVTRHYYRHLKGEKTSTNPIATIFAWTGALAKRGELDGLPELQDFAKKLEFACMQTLESGVMTQDLALLAEGSEKTAPVTTDEFLAAVAARLS
ncbi:MAG: NADP-dependent isocitrate dehydrogenase [Oscillospiraceae bacterium]|jgi:isocitrate dehydrogenase|nr:NADP-dependent isocitrate dehydrogenase [Oscillospiraceae bacterium]